MVKIISDSTCDLTPELLEKYDITLTPLYIVSGDKEYRDGVNLIPAELFKKVEEEKQTFTTAAVNIFDYEKIFEEFSATHDEIVQINISKDFSACNQNALIAAEGFPKVRIADSRNLSSGSGHMVLDAAIMAKEGKSADEIVEYINEKAPYVNASFIIDKLDYLHRGGRCNLAKLITTKILGIKPCIEVCDGKMRVGKKYRGKFAAVLDDYVKDRLANPDNIDLSRCFITHTTCTPEIVEQVRNSIKKCADFKEVIETKAGCTISNHCGPNTLGILFKQKTPYV